MASGFSASTRPTICGRCDRAEATVGNLLRFARDDG
jgi:hypothetical protein